MDPEGHYRWYAIAARRGVAFGAAKYRYGKKIIVQAKRYSNKVGIKAVQEISAARSFYNADECWVVTNNYFTNPAYNLAKSNNVILKDREILIDWIIEMKQEKILKKA